MSELITEVDNEEIERGRKQKLKHEITKQKFVENNNTYVLFNVKDLMFQTNEEQTYLISEMSKTLKKFLNNEKKVLVVGLGNRHISADSFGAECLKRVIATRNLINAKTEVSVISTSVFGLTGIESADIIKSVANVVKPNLIIIIDTLCANSYETLANNFQISNNGFNPGAGVGNKRKSVNKHTMNVKVVSVGVPFVVYAKSFIEYAVNNTMLNNFDTKILNELLKQDFNNLILTVKDIDFYIKKCSYLVASAINMALNDFTVEEQELILGKE